MLSPVSRKWCKFHVPNRFNTPIQIRAVLGGDASKAADFFTVADLHMFSHYSSINTPIHEPRRSRSWEKSLPTLRHAWASRQRSILFSFKKINNSITCKVHILLHDFHCPGIIDMSTLNSVTYKAHKNCHWWLIHGVKYIIHATWIRNKYLQQLSSRPTSEWTGFNRQYQ